MSKAAILAGLDEAMRHYSAFLQRSNAEAGEINATAAALRAENVKRAASGVRIVADGTAFESRDLALKTRALRHFEARAKVAHAAIGGLQAAVCAAAEAVAAAEGIAAQQAKLIDLLRAERSDNAAELQAARAEIADLQAKLTEAEARLSRYGSGVRYGNR